MKRDPAEIYIKERMDSISVKKIRPLFLWHQCEKCHKEFRREPMYHCSYLKYFGNITMNIMDVLIVFKIRMNL